MREEADEVVCLEQYRDFGAIGFFYADFRQIDDDEVIAILDRFSPRHDRRHPMRVGAPKEIKDNEFRVALTPAGVCELAQRGHVVLVERGAGVGAGLSDARL